MIGGIGDDADIALYLNAEELRKLPDETIEGVLVKFSRPKRQGTVNISINDKRSNENGYGIGINDDQYWGKQDDFHIDVFMGTEWYQCVVERGVIGLRQRMLDGSKITVYDRSRMDGVDRVTADTLEFYRDNKERLPIEFE